MRIRGLGVIDDATLIVSRTVSEQGRSRAHLGGRAVPVGVLAELSDGLLAVHGQSDQMRLTRGAEQRTALDRYAGDRVAALLADHREAYTRWQRLLVEHDDRVARARELSQEADLLRHGLAEIAAVDPQPAEDHQLAAEASRLSHADALRLAAQTAHDALAGDPAVGEAAADASMLLGAARYALDGAAANDPALGALSARLTDLSYQLTDVAAELSSYLAGLEVDPARLAEVEQRRSELVRLTRKYADDVDGVLAWADEAGGWSPWTPRRRRWRSLPRTGTWPPRRSPNWPARCMRRARRRRSGSAPRSPLSWPAWPCQAPGSPPRYGCGPRPPAGRASR